MSAHAIRWQSWELAEEADRQFRRVLLACALPMLAFILILPFLNLTGLTPGGGSFAGERYVELISEREDVPVAEKTEEAAPAEEDQEDPIEPEAEPDPEPVEEVVAPKQHAPRSRCRRLTPPSPNSRPRRVPTKRHASAHRRPRQRSTSCHRCATTP